MKNVRVGQSTAKANKFIKHNEKMDLTTLLNKFDKV